MARGRKKEWSQEPSELASKASEEVGFGKALSNFKRRNVEKARLMMDKEVMLLFAKKRMPSLEASQNEWDKLFKKF